MAKPKSYKPKIGVKGAVKEIAKNRKKMRKTDKKKVAAKTEEIVPLPSNDMWDDEFYDYLEDEGNGYCSCPHCKGCL